MLARSWPASLALAILVGVAYARLALRHQQRAIATLIAFVAVAALASVAILWPVLGANYRGLSGAPATALSIACLVLTYAAFAATLVLAFDWQLGSSKQRPSRSGRRATIAVGLASAVAGITSLAVLRHLLERSTFDYDGLEFRDPELVPVVPNERFYSVTKNVVDPDIERAWWRLDVGGLIERPLSLTYRDLLALPSTRQETTLKSCGATVPSHGPGLSTRRLSPRSTRHSSAWRTGASILCEPPV